MNHLQFPSTKTGKSLRGYIEAQIERDGGLTEEILAEDVVFNGLLYKVQGKQQLVTGFTDFFRDFLTSHRVEAIAPAPRGQWMILNFCRVKGSDKEHAIVDLVSFNEEGKIVRIDNCFDTSTMPEALKENSKVVSNVLG